MWGRREAHDAAMEGTGRDGRWMLGETTAGRRASRRELGRGRDVEDAEAEESRSPASTTTQPCKTPAPLTNAYAHDTYDEGGMNAPRCSKHWCRAQLPR